jgi:hypothetical protein
MISKNKTETVVTGIEMTGYYTFYGTAKIEEVERYVEGRLDTLFDSPTDAVGAYKVTVTIEKA